MKRRYFLALAHTMTMMVLLDNKVTFAVRPLTPDEKYVDVISTMITDIIKHKSFMVAELPSVFILGNEAWVEVECFDGPAVFDMFANAMDNALKKMRVREK